MIKPDPKIFLHVLEHINYKPSECIFIDDNRKNVKVAEQIGMIGIQFRNETKILEEIKEVLSIN
ncbi:MAG: HAD-IA family hydrolase, partial [Candidatus Lokiarchaeota archaeon]|nr:HAD-IA family hydrolase [Candidatus Lokiarchaeota archaeon]